MIRLSDFITLMVLAVGVLVSSVSIADGQRPFDLYQPIIDKCPFGPPPDDPTVMPDKSSASEREEAMNERELTKEQEQLEKAVSVSALVNKPDGTIMVGFSDSSQGKTPFHYYLAVGEEKSGWLVKSADITSKTVVLVKDGIEIERALGDKNAATVASAKDKPDARPASPRSGLLARRPGMGVGGPMSRRSRRRFNEEEERRADQQREERLKKAEAAAALRREQDRAEKEAERAETMEKLQDLRNQLDRMREQKNAAGQNETGGAQ